MEILTCEVTLLGGGAFGRRLGPEGAALVSGVRALVKELPQLPSAIRGYSREKTVISNPGKAPQSLTVLAPGSWISSLQKSET